MGKLGIAAFVAIAIGQASAQDAALQSAKLKITGGEIAYDTAGSGPAVVFLHGGFMDRRAWDAQPSAQRPSCDDARVLPRASSTPPSS